MHKAGYDLYIAVTAFSIFNYLTECTAENFNLGRFITDWMARLDLSDELMKYLNTEDTVLVFILFMYILSCLRGGKSSS
jgi:hypothetical protein